MQATKIYRITLRVNKELKNAIKKVSREKAIPVNSEITQSLREKYLPKKTA